MDIEYIGNVSPRKNDESKLDLWYFARDSHIIQCFLCLKTLEIMLDEYILIMYHKKGLYEDRIGDGINKDIPENPNRNHIENLMRIMRNQANDNDYKISISFYKKMMRYTYELTGFRFKYGTAIYQREKIDLLDFLNSCSLKGLCFYKKIEIIVPLAFKIEEYMRVYNRKCLL